MIYIQGKIVGVLDKQGQPKKDEKTGVVSEGGFYGVVGIQTEGKDWNGFEKLDTVSVSVYRDNFKERLHDLYKGLVGETVLMPVEVGAGNAGRLNYVLAGLPLKPSHEAIAPVRKSATDTRVAPAGAPTPVQPAAARA